MTGNRVPLPAVVAISIATMLIIALLFFLANLNNLPGGNTAVPSVAASVPATIPGTTPPPAVSTLPNVVASPTLNPTLQPPPTFTPLASVPATTPTATSPAPAGPYPRPVDEAEVETILGRLTLPQKIAQMLMVGLPGPTLDAVALQRVSQQGVGGVILLETNLTSPQQAAQFTAALQAEAMQNGPSLPLLVGWNQEGGTVHRRTAGITHFPSAMALGAANRPDLLDDIGMAVGQEMLSLGVNVNFAPVLDINNNPANPVIGLRSFGETPQIAQLLGIPYITGQQQAGIIAVAKHFPGHGNVTVDSHISLPLLDSSMEGLQQTELPPFQSALDAGVAAVMVAHLQIPAVEPSGAPSTLSRNIVTGLLREQMGFDGVVMTDDMGMGAILNSYTLEEATILAVEAGNDLLLSVETQSYAERMQTALQNAVANGRISEERINQSVRRLIRLKLAYGLGEPAPQPLLPDQEAHQALAREVGMAAVRVVADNQGWLPLALPNNQLLVVSPTPLNPGSVVGDGRSLLAELLAARGIGVQELFYVPDNPAGIAEVQAQALALAPTVDAVVIVTWDANLRYLQDGQTAQETLVNALLGSGKPVVVAFGQLPYDSTRVPAAPAQIALYGDTAGQLEGLVSLLLP